MSCAAKPANHEQQNEGSAVQFVACGWGADPENPEEILGNERARQVREIEQPQLTSSITARTVK